MPAYLNCDSDGQMSCRMVTPLERFYSSTSDDGSLLVRETGTVIF